MVTKKACPNCKSLGYYKCPVCVGARETENGPCIRCNATGLLACPCRGR